MAELASLIIQQQWQRRHDSNELVRTQARNLIKTHVEMLRRWRKEKDSAATASFSRSQNAID